MDPIILTLDYEEYVTLVHHLKCTKQHMVYKARSNQKVEDPGLKRLLQYSHRTALIQLNKLIEKIQHQA